MALTRLWKKCGDIDKTIEEVAHDLEFGDSENGESNQSDIVPEGKNCSEYIIQIFHECRVIYLILV